MKRRGWLVEGVVIAAVVALALLGAHHRAGAPRELPPGDEPAAAEPSAHPSIGESSIDGRDFPDGVLALTWDDGPDERTLALATFLNERKVSATFFVVAEWFAGISSDPGFGRAAFETGYDRIPILPDLLRLGHRLGNHTLHHVLLTEVPPANAESEVRENQRRLDPLLTNELRLIRAPGGAWDDTVARALAADPYLDGVVGPLRWDVDRKDWEGATGCASSRAEVECEPSPLAGHAQVKPAIVAARYLASIETAKHGIVLFHDRVGHVGSEYPLDVARALIPVLEARGYVFAAPVLRFSPLSVRTPAAPVEISLHVVGLADADGDGRADLCAFGVGGVTCAASLERAPAGDRPTPSAAFAALPSPPSAPSDAGLREPLALADVDGDGRADLCSASEEGVVCARAAEGGTFAPPRTWWATRGSELRLGDLDGDGKADACQRVGSTLTCARSNGQAFTSAAVWSREAPSLYALADIDGDGRADLCALEASGISCGTSRRTAFAPRTTWSTSPNDADALAPATIRFADLNGDGRADACGRVSGGIACALSTAHRFTRPTLWVQTGGSEMDRWNAEADAHFHLGDVNGDGRADLCVAGAPPAGGVLCGMAP